MRATELMSTPVITVSPEATVAEAARLMIDRNVSCLPVVDGGDRLVGILTHSDFGLHHRFVPLAGNLYTLLGSWADTRTFAENARASMGKRVADVMTRDVVTVKDDDSVSQVAATMLNRHVKRTPVMRGKTLLGVITQHDMLKLFFVSMQEHDPGGDQAKSTS